MIIPGFSAYDITEDGVVTHVESSKVMQRYKAQSNKNYLYMRVNLIGDDGKRHACNLLRLLALAYLPKPDLPCVARAKDSDNLNVKLSNVEWAPYAESTFAAWKNGRYTNRQPKKNACVTKESMDLILNTLEQLDHPVSTTDLCALLEVPYSTIRYSVEALVQHGKVKKIPGKGFVAV